MSIYILALLIGVIAGLRSMTAPAAIGWAVRLGRLPIAAWAPAATYILTVLAIGELIADKLPKTPSRKAPPGFIFRLITGAISGGAIGVPSNSMVACGMAGMLGAVVGTLGGYEFRVRLVRATGGRDLPIALLEDAIAVIGAILIVCSL